MSERELGDPDPEAIIHCDVCGEDVIRHTMTMHVVSQKHSEALERILEKPIIIDKNADLFSGPTQMVLKEAKEQFSKKDKAEKTLNETRLVVKQHYLPQQLGGAGQD
jgi:hypothetical protein